MNKRIKFLIFALVTVSAIGFTVKIASAMTWGALKVMYLEPKQPADGGGSTPTNTPPPANTNTPPPPAK